MDAPLFMPGRSGLQTELYQLVQAAVYHADGLWGEATFDLYARDLPAGQGYLVAAGIEPAVDAILGIRFSEEEIEWVRRHPIFSRVPERFFDSLRHFRFEGDVWAVPEGTVVFPGEPMVRVSAPLPQAGLLETGLIQTVSHASNVATRGARLAEAAGGRPIIDFGSRRCPGPEAAWHAARAAWIGGVAATTNALAAATLGIPSWGVMSDSLLAAYDDGLSAYEALRQHFPDQCHVNLPDGDVHGGVARLAAVRAHVPTVRLSTRDLANQSAALRRSLDRHGMRSTRILGSGSLDEAAIAALVAGGAPVDLFGVGGGLVRSTAGAGFTYRISEMYRGPDPSPVTSPWSAPWPGRKQVMRFPGHDLVCLDVEAHAHEADGGAALLRPVVEGGARVERHEALANMRARCAVEVRALPAEVRAIGESGRWPVRASDAVAELAARG